MRLGLRRQLILAGSRLLAASHAALTMAAAFAAATDRSGLASHAADPHPPPNWRQFDTPVAPIPSTKAGIMSQFSLDRKAFMVAQLLFNYTVRGNFLFSSIFSARFRDGRSCRFGSMGGDTHAARAPAGPSPTWRRAGTGWAISLG